jgi:hypothetical protein
MMRKKKGEKCRLNVKQVGEKKKISVMPENTIF